MAGKARRVASRQAQIGRRKKRQTGVPGEIQVPVFTPAEADGHQPGADAPSPAAEPPDPPQVPAPVASRPARPSPVAARNAAMADATGRSPSRGRRERPATANFIGTEVRRILCFSGVVMAVIIVLGVVL